MRFVPSLSIVALVWTAVVSPVSAESPHTAPMPILERAVQEHVASAAADGEAVRRLLALPEVQAIASDVGIDLRRAKRAVGTLEPSQLADVASRARQAERALSGGQSRMVISTTTIIIALLVIILIIVAVK